MTDGIYDFNPILVTVNDVDVICVNQAVAEEFLDKLKDETPPWETLEIEELEPVTIALNVNQAVDLFLEYL